MKRATIGFSIHRPEMIPLTAALLRCHDAIFLEEPPVPEFRQMLEGAFSIDDYLLLVDVEYPEFSRSMCRLLRELYQNGKNILQVEPFLQNLLEIHAFFSQGHHPKELRPESIQQQVYLAERDATKALLAGRSLIYTKLIENEELSADLKTFPHVRNERACIQTVNLLTLDDCGRLFPLIRRLKTAHARQLVEDYFLGVKKYIGQNINRPSV